MESTLSRRERERLMRREAMLSAAQAVFAEKGYTQATLEEIAQRAEFGKGTLYNYFEGGKEAILYAIFDELYGDFIRRIENAFSGDPTDGRPFPQVFERFVYACFQFFDERREQFMIMMREAQRLSFAEDEAKAHYFIRQGQNVVDSLVPYLDAAVARGEMRPLNTEHVAHMVFGNIKGFQLQARLHPCREEGEEKEEISIDEATAFVTDFLLQGLLPRHQGRNGAKND